MAGQFDENCEPDVYIVTPPDALDETDMATAIFAAELEQQGYFVVAQDRIKNDGIVKAVTTYGLELHFMVSPAMKVIRMLHRWDLDETVTITNAKLRQALNEANAGSWWNNYSLDRTARALVVSSYVTVGEGFVPREIREFFDRQLEAFFEDGKNFGFEIFLGLMVKRQT